jgi:hypothetical protein
MSTQGNEAGAADQGGPFGLLRSAAVLAALGGAAGSIALMLRVARPPLLLMAMFIVWVLSPFAGLLWLLLVSKSWPRMIRVTLYGLTAILTVGSLAIYGHPDWRPPGTRPAFIFLTFPLASWLLIGFAVAVAYRFWAKRRRISSTP